MLPDQRFRSLQMYFRATVLLAWPVLIISCGGSDEHVPVDGAADVPVVAEVRTADDLTSRTELPRELRSIADLRWESTEEVSTVFPCSPADPVAPMADFFSDVSDAAGIRVNAYIMNPDKKVPINDHSRLGFADINGDGFDDMVMHSLYPNPQAGVPFEHLVFVNNGDGTFTDFSEESGLRDVQAGFFAFGDVDNDGDQDCFAGLDVQLPGEGHEMLLNDGSGHFTSIPWGGESVAAAAGNAVFGDFNGDAKLDLFIGLGHTSFSGPDVLLRGNGDGTFTDVSANLAVNQAHPTNGCVTCDFDNDGDLDIVVSTYGVSVNLGLNVLWQNDGSGHFTDVSVEKGFASLPGGNYFLQSTDYGATPEPGKGPGTYMGSNGFGLDCDDINNDGEMDIFLTAISHPVSSDYNRKWSDPTQVLINQGPEGGYAFENKFQKLGLPFNEGDVDGAAVDFDNDGRLDLSISRDNKYEKPYEDIDQKSWFGLMHQLPDGSFESVGPASGINNLETGYSASITECESDAQCVLPETCLFTRCRFPCTNDADCVDVNEKCVWLFNADLGQHQSFCRPLTKMKKAQNHAWADVDRDGDLDLLVGGRDFGGGRPNFLFANDIGSNNRWIALHIVGDGAQVNRDAIGARVELLEPGFTQVREVQASRGMHNSMDGRALHFGMGAMGCDYEMRVRWPDGTTATFAAGKFPERTYLKLTYPDTLGW
jgi:enediyne biosynthesis protein E4